LWTPSQSFAVMTRRNGACTVQNASCLKSTKKYQRRFAPACLTKPTSIRPRPTQGAVIPQRRSDERRRLARWSRSHTRERIAAAVVSSQSADCLRRDRAQLVGCSEIARGWLVEL